MRVWRKALALLAAVCLLPLHAGAAGAPAVSAASAILVDGESGRVLYEKDAHVRRSIASTTKLMTALVVMDRCRDLGEVVEVLEEDTRTEGSSMYLRAGDQVTVEELLYGLLLSSGNDAALVLARRFGGSVEGFTALMNEKAAELGMADSSFANPNGLEEEGHWSTAADMAKLGAACLEDETIAKIVSTPSISLGGRYLTNHNKLLGLCEGCVGLKTGYTEKAGRTLVSAVRREGQLLICVTLQDPDDWDDHMALYDYGSAAYPRQVLVEAGARTATLPVTGSLVPAVEVETADTVAYPLAEGERPRVEIHLPEGAVAAPLEREVPVGELRFYLDGEPIGRTDLVYSASVRRDAAPPPPLRRLWDRLTGGGG